MTGRAHRSLMLVSVALLLSGCGAQRSVVLVTVDTLRADRVGLYGGGTLPTPNMDSIGREGFVAEQCVAPFGRTTQSVGSIHTGLHPLSHGADGLGMALPDDVETLAELLRSRGHRTAAFVSNLALRPGLGFEQGFDVFLNPESRWIGNSAGAITSEGLAWLRDHVDDRVDEPFFLWLHYLDPHWPYNPKPETARRADPEWSGPFPLSGAGDVPRDAILFNAEAHLTAREIEYARRLYDAEVADTDAAIGKLLDGLDELGLSESVLLVLTADHGESLGEHSYWFGHGEYLYDETLRVPLLMRAPGLIPAGMRLGGLIRLEDLAPTLLELLGLDVPADLDGRSFAAAIRSGSPRTTDETAALQLTDHILVREGNPRRSVSGRRGRWTAVREERWKLIRIPLGEDETDEELFDIGEDPGETTNLASARPEEAERLRARLAEILASVESGRTLQDEPEVDEHLDTLRGLGYAK